MVENYKDHKELGRAIMRDFTKLIDVLYPKEEIPDWIEAENQGHRYFMLSKHKIYIGKSDYFERLDDFVEGDSVPIILTGDEGAGKTALLANWILHFQKKYSNTASIIHFVGSTTLGSDWAKMLHRILGELKRKFNINKEIPKTKEEIRSVFNKWLKIAAAKGRLVLIIDALDQLNDEDTQELIWLPNDIPKNIRFICSTKYGSTFKKLEKRKWITFKIEPLGSDEQKKFIENYLKQYSKKLEPEITDLITSKGQVSNPLFLKTLLEELRIFGSNTLLAKQIDYYLESDSIKELYKKVLHRYEIDFDKDYKGLINNIFTLIWASRKGLSESEILDLLELKRIYIARRDWSVFYIAAEHLFRLNSGLITFSHISLQNAVKEYFMQTDEIKLDTHRFLSDYFFSLKPDQQKIDILSRDTNQIKRYNLTHSELANLQESYKPSSRVLEELPWQYEKAFFWEKLFDLLSELPFLKSLWANNPNDACQYWTEIEKITNKCMIKAYHMIISNPYSVFDDSYIYIVAKLLSDFGYLKEANSIYDFIQNNSRLTGNHSQIIQSKLAKGINLSKQGQFEEAMKYFQDAESLANNIMEWNALANSYINQCAVYIAMKCLEKAKKLASKSEEIFRTINDKYGMAITKTNQAMIFKNELDYSNSLALYEESELMFREIGAVSSLAYCLGNKANVLYAITRLEEALEYHEENEKILRKLGDYEGLSQSLANQSLLHTDLGSRDKALNLIDEAVQIATEHNLNYTLIQIKPITSYVHNSQVILNEKNSIKSDTYWTNHHNSAIELYKNEKWDDAEIAFRELLAAGMPDEEIIPYLIKSISNQNRALDDKQLTEFQNLLNKISKSDKTKVAIELSDEIEKKTKQQKNGISIKSLFNRLCKK